MRIEGQVAASAPRRSLSPSSISLFSSHLRPRASRDLPDATAATSTPHSTHLHPSRPPAPPFGSPPPLIPPCPPQSSKRPQRPLASTPSTLQPFSYSWAPLKPPLQRWVRFDYTTNREKESATGLPGSPFLLDSASLAPGASEALPPSPLGAFLVEIRHELTRLHLSHFPLASPAYSST